MRLHYNTVSELLLECLQKLMNNEAFNDFVLVGGTALSLQLGHRMSVDIDLFTALPYGSMNLEQLRKSLYNAFNYTQKVEQLSERALGYTIYVGKNKKRKYQSRFILY